MSKKLLHKRRIIVNNLSKYSWKREDKLSLIPLSRLKCHPRYILQFGVMNYVLQHNARNLKHKITMNRMVDTFLTRVKRETSDNTKVPNITVYVRERVNTQSLPIIYDGFFATHPVFCICQHGGESPMHA